MSTALQNITVHALPTVTLAPLPNQSEGGASIVLTQGSPAGGTYTGTGISGGSFYPIVAGLGTFPITYTYDDGNCTNSDVENITVNSLPELGNYIKKINSGNKKKVVVIEDFSHLLGQRVIQDAKIQGFGKWTNLAVDAHNAFLDLEKSLREDLTIIVIGHTETESNDLGATETHLLTPGKLLDRVVKIPSYFTYVLHTHVIEDDDGVKYKFLTNRNGMGKEAKSPEGCLDLLEDNDLALILGKIDAYQEKA